MALIHCVLSKGNPADLNLDNSKIRPHILRCLNANKISEFPTTETKIKKCKEKLFDIEVFCSCRSIWRKQNYRIRDKQMVECSECFEWYHRICENIDDIYFMKNNASVKWFCKSCDIKKSR